jgi:hypothetical protein
MMLQVSVPVLSLKTYCTYPSSSLRLEDYTYVRMPWNTISSSLIIHTPCVTFTISRVTSREIGTRLDRMSIQLKNFTMNVVNISSEEIYMYWRSSEFLSTLSV